MQLTKTKHKEILEVYSTWMDAYLNADVSTYDSYFDDDYHFIGSTNNEEFLNRKDTTEFFRVTGEQFAGLMDLRNESKTLEQFGNHVLLTHMCDTWFKNDEDWSYYGRFRLSSVLHNTKAGWKFIYQHFSMPDAKSEEGQSIGFDKVHLENQELREAIQRRTKELELKNRELEVESALERIRSQAVAMKASTDLLDIVVTMRNEFIKLGHEAHYFWHMMWLPKTYEKAMTSGDGSKIGFVMTLPKHMHGDIPLLAKWEKSKKPTVVYTMNAEEAIDYVDKMVTLGDFKNIDPQAPTHDDIKHIGGLTFIMARTTHGEIGYSLPGVVQNPPKEDLDQLIRFAGTFDLAHQRFLDLQKTEAQAKETKVELSLERIRSRVAEMKASSDLFDIVVTMRNEFLSLGHEADYFWHMRWLEDSYEMSMTAEDGGRLGMVISVPKFVHEHIASLHQWEKSNNPYFILALNGKEAWDYIDNMNTHGKYQQIDPHAPTEEDILHIGGLTFIIARTTHGEIGFSLAGKVPNPPKESIEILLRFAKVFDLAYKRFEDLQKAEKQARETQIELGLEKVRSRSMAMHHTSELLDTAAELFHQLEDLGIKPWRCGMAILNTDDTKFEFWSETTTPKGRRVSVNGTTSITGKTHKHVKGAVKAIKEKKDFYNYDLSGKNLIDYINYITQDFNLPEASQNVTELPERLVYYCATFSRGVIYGAFLTTIKTSEQQTLKRFAKVFDQSYTRFLDLQKAEAQAREAQIEAALEKVRSRSLAVHKSEEFKDVISIVFDKLKELQIPATAVGIGIKINGSKDLDSFVCGENEEGLVITNYRLPYFNNKISKDICNAFDNGADVFIGQYTKAEKNSFYKYVLDKTSEFKDLPENILGMIFNSLSYTITMVSSEYVVFNINDFEGKSLTEHEIDIVKRFLRVFNQAYIRFLDLQKAEAQAKEAQIETALERVRSRTMAMQHSDELAETSFLLDKQVRELGIKTWGCAFNIYGENESTEWFGNEAGILQTYSVPREGIFKQYYDKGQKGEKLYIQEFSGEECIAHYEYMSSLAVIGDVLKTLKETNHGFPTYQIDHVVYFKYGYLLFITREDVPFAHDIFKRFAKVFEQTYTRFLDLQKAEAQARESKIEAALERVRSRSMAMHHTSELQDVINTVHQQFTQLDIEISGGVFIGINQDIKDTLKCWGSGGTADYIQQVDIPYMDLPIYTDIIEGIKKGPGFFTEQFTQEEKINFLTELFKIPPYNSTSKAHQKEVLSRKGGYTRSCAVSENSCIFIISHHGHIFSKETNTILRRFAKVFEQAYTRFLDLQKAEAQAREALIEAALERIRSRSMAMQNSDEFQDVIQVVYNQFELLGLNIDHTGFILDYKNQEDMHIVLADNNAVFPEIRLPYFDCAHWNSFKKAKKNGDTLFTNQLDFKEKNQFYDDIFRFIPDLPKETKTHYLKVPGLAISTVLLDSIGLYIENFEGIPYSYKDNSILMRFGKAFQQTYTRFLDLQKAEAQAREAQIQLSLERVRAKSMAMQSSDQLHDIIGLVFQQFDKLEIHPVNVFLSLFDRHKRILTYRASGKSGKRTPTKQDVDIDSVEAWTDLYNKWINDSSDEIEVLFYPKEIVPDILNLLKDTFLAMPKKDRMTTKDFPEGGYSTLGYTPFGYLGYDHTRPPTEEEKDILKRICTEFGRVYQRFLDLQKAEAQAREAQINLAVERVRAKALAMHKSEEIIEVVAKLKDEVMGLNIPGVVAATIFLEAENDSIRMWDLSSLERTDQGYLAITDITFKLKKKDPHLYVKRVWENPEDYFIEMQNSKDLDRIIEFMYENNQREIAKEVEDYTKSTNLTKLYHASKRLSNGKLCIDLLEEPPEEMQTILNKMGAAFDLAYKRFEDIKKAEIQAKEAQIEAALERVRSRSMAMQKSDELKAVVSEVFEKLKGLNIAMDAACIYTFTEGSKDRTEWVANPELLSTATACHVPFTNATIYTEFMDAWEKGQDFFIRIWTEEEKNAYWKLVFEHSDYKNYSDEVKKIIFDSPGWGVSGGISKNSATFLVSYSEKYFSEDENEIVKRFGKVFEQAYTRFLDLQKAEEQAREAQIEAALERIRSRSMAMHNTSELSEVILVLFNQFKLLGLTIDTCIIDIFDELNAGFSVWIGTGTAIYPKQVFLPYMDHPIHQLNKDARQGKIDFFTFDEDKDSKDRYFKHFYANAKGIEVPQERRELIANGVGITGAAALGKHSGVHIWNYRGIKYTNEENDILRRVNKVFQQTYTRFLDLQKAEAREREAIIQASLDRVRAEIASMRDTKDLERITPLVWSELQSLGVPFFRCGVMLVNEDTNILDFYLSNPKGQALAALHLDFDSSDIARNGYEYWQKKEIYIEHWDQNQFTAFIKQLMSQGQITDADTYQGGEKPPTSLTLQFVPFTQGMVYVGSELALSKEELDLVDALGKSLSVAYARYEDFTKLDIAKAKAEKALLDLKSVQQQMIQQEKLASLGQLTAGIAHEIKNPLNFVNNFSDLSIELLDEVFTELEQIPDSDSKEEILAILKDVKGNLSKVTEHGTRADGIVTSMLQHSRASGSKREPKPFNPLVKEFVNLSFHGMRAGKSPINVKIDLQLDPKVENVTLISEDFSRVILNLCNNAFDAMRDKLIKTKNSSHYSAQLIIQTLKEKNSVTLFIKDNGPGIPDSIKDKILQPFFTTKKGTEGTGLGLSITNDIIKAHGGELTIESVEDNGTTFRIQLPN